MSVSPRVCQPSGPSPPTAGVLLLLTLLLTASVAALNAAPPSDAAASVSAATACRHLSRRPGLRTLCLSSFSARVRREVSAAGAASENAVDTASSSAGGEGGIGQSRCAPNQTSAEPHLRALCPFRVYERRLGDVTLTAAECLCPLSSCGAGGSFECTPLQAEVRYRQQGRLVNDSVTVACVCAAPAPGLVRAKRPPSLWDGPSDPAGPLSPQKRGAPAAEQVSPVVRAVRHGHGHHRQQMMLRHSWRF